ncbi:MAG: bifunctional phosphoglucose/phosphomannose isomerase, partial [Calditrichaeota bacterium]
MSFKAQLSRYDKSGMLNRVLNMPEHFKEAWQSNQDIQVPYSAGQIDNVVVAGMGGSAMSGDVVRCAFSGRLPLPFYVNRGYTLPHFVNENTLVFASSYSGNTEETLSCFNEARQRNAKIVCITSGGVLATHAREWDLPCFQLPGGYPPRSALVFLTIPLLQSLIQLGWVDDLTAEISETTAVLENLSEIYHPDNESETNLPFAIANRVYQKIPIVYASNGLPEAAATRWRTQFSENAKILAYGNLFPEMNHNEIVGWGLYEKLDKNLQPIYLRDREDHARIKLRMDITREMIEQSSPPVLEIWAEGNSPLARIFSLIFTGDLASVYLAGK